jgi:hypothetical protein
MMTSDDLRPDGAGRPESVVDSDGAATMLGVEPSRIPELIDQGLLHPLEGYGSPTFDTSEVQAVHSLGG